MSINSCSYLLSSLRTKFLKGKALWLAVSIGIGCALLFLPPEIVLGAVLSALFGLLIVISPYIGIITLLACVYLRPGEHIPSLGALHLTRILAFSVLAAWILLAIRHKRFQVIRNYQILILLGFLGIMCFSTLTAYWQTQAMSYTIDFAKIVLMYFLVLQLVDSPRKLKIYIWVLVLLNGWLAIEAISKVPHHGFGRVGALGGYFADANDFALTLLVAVPFAYFMLISEKRKALRLAALSMLSLFIFALLLTGSRGGAIGLAVVLLALIIKSRKKPAAVIVLVFLMILGAFMIPTTLKERLSTVTTYGEDASAKGRLGAWKAALHMASDHPLLGTGPGNFAVSYGTAYKPVDAVSDAWYSAHSIYFQVLGELGVTGLVCFALLILTCFTYNHLVRTRKLEATNTFHSVSDAVDVAVVGYIVAGAFLSVAYYPHLYIILGLCAANNHLSSRYLVGQRSENV